LRGQTMYPLCGRTDRQTDRQGETYIPPANKLFAGGIITVYYEKHIMVDVY